MTDDHEDALSERVDRLRDELRATEEHAAERATSRWIGEAQAVAGDADDIATTDASDEVVRERVDHVVDLLANVEGTGGPDADERVKRAKTLAEIITDGA